MLYIQTGPYDHLDHLEKKQAEVASLCIYFSLTYILLYSISLILYYIFFFDSFVGYVNGKASEPRQEIPPQERFYD